jgi:hypothetical protein
MPQRRDSHNHTRRFCNAARTKRVRRNALVDFARPLIVPPNIVDELTITDDNLRIVPKTILCTVHDEANGDAFNIHLPIPDPGE